MAPYSHQISLFFGEAHWRILTVLENNRWQVQEGASLSRLIFFCCFMLNNRADPQLIPLIKQLS